MIISSLFAFLLATETPPDSENTTSPQSKHSVMRPSSIICNPNYPTTSDKTFPQEQISTHNPELEFFPLIYECGMEILFQFLVSSARCEFFIPFHYGYLLLYNSYRQAYWLKPLNDLNEIVQLLKSEKFVIYKFGFLSFIFAIPIELEKQKIVENLLQKLNNVMIPEQVSSSSSSLSREQTFFRIPIFKINKNKPDCITHLSTQECRYMIYKYLAKHRHLFRENISASEIESYARALSVQRKPYGLSYQKEFERVCSYLSGSKDSYDDMDLEERNEQEADSDDRRSYNNCYPPSNTPENMNYETGN